MPENSLTFLDRFNDSVVSVRLESIQHLADRSDEVVNDFRITLAVNGAGELLTYNERLTIQPGTSETVRDVFHHFNYGDIPCNVLLTHNMTFLVTVITNEVSNTILLNAIGKLTVGVHSLKIPVVLERGSRKSTIVLRGRVDVSCPNS